MEKMIKRWKDECLPKGPKSFHSPPPASLVGDGHKLCRPDPDETKATWNLTHPSQAP